MEVFFLVLTAMVIISTIAFILLNKLPAFKRERASNYNYSAAQTSTPPVSLEYQNANNASVVASAEQPSSNHQDSLITEEEDGYKSKEKYLLLLALQGYLCFISNGAFPSIQTYSCLPFGNVVYHLAVTLNAMANPVMAFAAFFFPCKNLRVLLLLSVLGTVFSSFILATALASPSMLWGQYAGGALVVKLAVLTHKS